MYDVIVITLLGLLLFMEYYTLKKLEHKVKTNEQILLLLLQGEQVILEYEDEEEQ